MVNGQSPFGTPPANPEIDDAPVGIGPSAPRRDEAGHGGVSVHPRAPEAPKHRPPMAESIPLQRAARRATRARQGWVVTLTTVIALIAIAACGAGTWFLMRDNATNTTAPGQAHTSDGASDPKAEPDRLSSRETDTEPLTRAELFGDRELTAGKNTYTVLKTDVLEDCGEAATEAMASLLHDGECSQVVRATVADAGRRHAATLGVVNLSDADAATRLREDIEDGHGGAFNALRASGVSAELGLNPTVLGFNTFGHYLLYVVIGRADGESPSRQDEEVSAIVGDLVDSYLVNALEPRRDQ